MFHVFFHYDAYKLRTGQPGYGVVNVPPAMHFLNAPTAAADVNSMTYEIRY